MREKSRSIPRTALRGRKKTAGCIGAAISSFYARASESRFFLGKRLARGESSRDDRARFRVPDNLDGDVLSCLVIQRANHLAEAPLADHLQDLISETQKYRLRRRRYALRNDARKRRRRREKRRGENTQKKKASHVPRRERPFDTHRERKIFVEDALVSHVSCSLARSSATAYI